MSNHYHEAWVERVYEDALEWAYENGFDDSADNFEDIVEARYQKICEAFE